MENWIEEWKRIRKFTQQYRVSLVPLTYFLQLLFAFPIRLALGRGLPTPQNGWIRILVLITLPRLTVWGPLSAAEPVARSRSEVLRGPIPSPGSTNDLVGPSPPRHSKGELIIPEAEGARWSKSSHESSGLFLSLLLETAWKSKGVPRQNSVSPQLLLPRRAPRSPVMC